MSCENSLLLVFEAALVGFSAAYAIANTALLVLGFNPARNRVRELSYSDLDLMDDDENCPPVTVVVPAYNEEVGIVESVRAFLELDYPRFEIVVVNDGSRDGTLERLRTAFSLVRRDVPVREELTTAPVRAVYEPSMPLPPTVLRLLVVDKENGGRADALNCGVNFSRSPYFITVDADSILDRTALKLVMRMIQDDPGIQAAGGQIGIVNECTVENGRVTKVEMPRSYLTLCQTLEYLRSFATSRTGLNRIGCLTILSGAFLLMQRGKAMELGGFLTGRVRSKLLDEYAGPGKSTIGEDMEMIVRLHRFERENGRAAKIAHSPLPVCWTEAPSTWRVLGRQRRRWHRGFLEILSYHGRMFLDPAYGRIGLLSIPYLVFFEFLGPYIEALGYVLLPILALLGLLDYGRAALVVAVALGFGVLHSTVAVLCATWLEPVVPGGTRVRSLMGMDAWRSRLLLLAACFLGETGYRQATVWWRLHGTWEFLRGVQSWGAMERKGFRTAAAGGAVAAVALLAAPSAACGADGWAPSAWTLGGLELRDGATPGSWAEAGGRWDETAAEERTGRAAWVGAFRIARRDDADGGLFAGGSLRPGRWGFAVEARVAPGAAVSSRWLLSCEGEALVRAPVAAAWTLRWSDYRDASVADLGTGTVLYLPNDAWLAVRAHLTRTTWSGGEADDVTGGTVTLHLPVGRTGLRLSASTGAESYLAGVDPEPRRLRATAAGLTTRVPIGSGWVVESGAAGRRPERGENDLYLHAGLRRRW